MALAFNARYRRSVVHCWFEVCLVLFSTMIGTAVAQDDVIVLLNGDRITGEIEALERGKLRVDTNAMGIVDIKWEQIASVESDESFEVQDEVGNLLTGTLQPTEVPDQIIVRSDDGDMIVPSAQVAVMNPIGQSFWTQLDGAIDAGVSFTQASSQFDYTFNGNVRHSTPGREVRPESHSGPHGHQYRDGQRRQVSQREVHKTQI